jgi:putative tricarboxylic transport membrane protein
VQGAGELASSPLHLQDLFLFPISKIVFGRRGDTLQRNRPEGKEGKFQMEGNIQKEKITAAALVGFSALYFVSSLRLEIGNLRNPGPGFFPIVVGFFLTVCTTIYLIRVIKRRTTVREEVPAAVERKDYRAIASIIASGIAYPLVLDTLKFLVSTFAVTFFMLYMLKPKKVLFSLLLAISMTIVSFIVFSRLLGVGLPMGPLEIFLFHIGG